MNIYCKRKNLKTGCESPSRFVKYYNYERYHESIQNLTPAEVYYGRAESKLRKRKNVKDKTLNARKKQYQKNQLTLN